MTSNRRRRHINIMGQRYKVVHAVKDPHTWGECDNGSKEIRIDANLPDDVWEDVFLHEIIHAIMYVSGVHNLCRKHSDEEAIVSAVGNGLSQLGLVFRNS